MSAANSILLNGSRKRSHSTANNSSAPLSNTNGQSIGHESAATSTAGQAAVPDHVHIHLVPVSLSTDPVVQSMYQAALQRLLAQHDHPAESENNTNCACVSGTGSLHTTANNSSSVDTDPSFQIDLFSDQSSGEGYRVRVKKDPNRIPRYSVNDLPFKLSDGDVPVDLTLFGPPAQDNLLPSSSNKATVHDHSITPQPDLVPKDRTASSNSADFAGADGLVDDAPVAMLNGAVDEDLVESAAVAADDEVVVVLDRLPPNVGESPLKPTTSSPSLVRQNSSKDKPTAAVAPLQREQVKEEPTVSRVAAAPTEDGELQSSSSEDEEAQEYSPKRKASFRLSAAAASSEAVHLWDRLLSSVKQSQREHYQSMHPKRNIKNKTSSPSKRLMKIQTKLTTADKPVSDKAVPSAAKGKSQHSKQRQLPSTSASSTNQNRPKSKAPIQAQHTLPIREEQPSKPRQLGLPRIPRKDPHATTSANRTHLGVASTSPGTSSPINYKSPLNRPSSERAAASSTYSSDLYNSFKNNQNRVAHNRKSSSSKDDAPGQGTSSMNMVQVQTQPDAQPDMIAQMAQVQDLADVSIEERPVRPASNGSDSAHSPSLHSAPVSPPAPARRRVHFALHIDQMTQVKLYRTHDPPNVVSMDSQESVLSVVDELLPDYDMNGNKRRSGSMLPPPAASDVASSSDGGGLVTAPRLSYREDIELVVLGWNPEWMHQYQQRLNPEGDVLSSLPPLLRSGGAGGAGADINNVLTVQTEEPQYSFTCLGSYYKYMKPMLCAELWETIYRHKQCVQTAPMTELFVARAIKESTGKHSWWTIKAGGIFSNNVINENDANGCFNEGVLLELFVSTSVAGKTAHYFAIVKKTEYVSLEHLDNCPEMLNRELSERLGDSPNVQALPNDTAVTVELRVAVKNHMPNTQHKHIQIKPVLNIVSNVRLAQSIASLQCSALLPCVLRPEPKHFTIQPNNDMTVLSQLQSSYNASQCSVISDLATDVCLTSHVPRIALVHGPPGTGKTKTVLGLIEELKRRRKQAALTSTGVCAPILLCAPSNGAVDQIMLQLMHENDRHSDKDEREQFYSLVRIGKRSQINRDVQKYWIDNLAQSQAKRRRDIPHIQEQLAWLSNTRKLYVSKTSGSVMASFTKKVHDLDTQIADWRACLLRAQQSTEVNASDMYHQRKRLIQSADVVATTLNSSGTSTLDMLTEVPLLCVIIDEAGQATELESLIPLRFQTNKLLLFGDPCQLPPTVLSPAISNTTYAMSLFERCMVALNGGGRGAVCAQARLLDTQYRMASSIVAFPSRRFYNDRLHTDAKVAADRDTSVFAPYLVFNLPSKEDALVNQSKSFTNGAECEYIKTVCSALIGQHNVQACDIGVISFYKEQVKLLREQLHSLQNRSADRLDVDTVDGFQGREKAFIIVSCVRTNKIGFLSDVRRMCVALTRAKYGCYVVGDIRALMMNQSWNALIVDARIRGVLVDVPVDPAYRQKAIQRLTKA